MILYLTIQSQDSYRGLQLLNDFNRLIRSNNRFIKAGLSYQP